MERQLREIASAWGSGTASSVDWNPILSQPEQEHSTRRNKYHLGGGRVSIRHRQKPDLQKAPRDLQSGTGSKGMVGASTRWIRGKGEPQLEHGRLGFPEDTVTTSPARSRPHLLEIHGPPCRNPLVGSKRQLARGPERTHNPFWPGHPTVVVACCTSRNSTCGR